MELIDKEVYDFFNENKKFKHNNKIKSIPYEFLQWRSNKDIKYKFYNWIKYESYVASFPLNINVPHDEILHEALAQQDLFVAHRSVGNHNGWSAMAIHGTAVHHTYPKRKYFSEENMPDYTWTDLAPKCPITKEWLLSLGFETFDRVRFMKLDPKGFIRPHTDHSSSNPYERGDIAWNVAINNPDGHNFVMENEGLIPWKPGEIRALDVSIKHAVFNSSHIPRIHMIVHGKPGDKFVHSFCESFELLFQI